MNLPKVYQNKNIGNVNNDQEYFYSLNKQIISSNRTSKEDINRKINKLFQSQKFIYKIRVIVVTTNGEQETIIIGKNNNNLITIDNNLIPINDILDIYEK